MKSLIIGKGEVGKALHNVLADFYPITAVDIHEDTSMEPEIMHVCFPFSKSFITEVKKYQKKYKPKFTIIHSTVPPGTSRICNAIHSPIIGLHPYLAESIKIFIKFLAGEKAHMVADYFRKAGIKVYVFDEPETTELLKILDTDFYALCIEYTKDVKRLCKKYKVPFEAWTLWTQNYNQGYEKLGYPEYTRPNLVPILRKIGGHCLLPNSEMLETEFTRLIKKLNE